MVCLFQSQGNHLTVSSERFFLNVPVRIYEVRNLDWSGEKIDVCVTLQQCSQGKVRSYYSAWTYALSS